MTDVISENRTEEEIEAEKKGRQSGKYKKVSLSDPDASMANGAALLAGRDWSTIRFRAQALSSSGSESACQLGKRSSWPARSRTRGRAILTLPHGS